MRPLSQGAARRAHARAARGAHAHRRARRSRTAAGTARLIGAIVAGGASARFGGAPKGLLPLGGRRLVDRVHDALSRVTTSQLIVSNAADAGDWIPGVRAVADVRRERGSLVGIHTALTAAADSVLVVAWDMPFVTPALLSLIVACAANAEYAVVPQGPAGPEPFCAVYTPACLPFIDAALDAEDLRLSAMLGRLPGIRLVSAAEIAAVGDAARLFFNVNDAAGLAEAERLLAAG